MSFDARMNLLCLEFYADTGGCPSGPDTAVIYDKGRDIAFTVGINEPHVTEGELDELLGVEP